MHRTESYQEAIEWALELGPEGLAPTVWIPEKGFRYALKNSEGSVAFTRDGSPNFGLGVGADPIIDPAWQRFALPRNLEKNKTIKFKLVNRWNPYMINTAEIQDTGRVQVIETNGVENFLDLYAPTSSVYPGNPETIFWAGIRIENELISVGCVGTWESGARVISSIATKTSERGKGFGSEITKGIVAICNKRGIEEVYLAVNAKNEVAARVYERIGFKGIGKFNTFER